MRPDRIISRAVSTIVGRGKNSGAPEDRAATTDAMRVAAAPDPASAPADDDGDAPSSAAEARSAPDASDADARSRAPVDHAFLVVVSPNGDDRDDDDAPAIPSTTVPARVLVGAPEDGSPRGEATLTHPHPPAPTPPPPGPSEELPSPAGASPHPRARFCSLLSVDSLPMTGSSVGSVTPCGSDSYTDTFGSVRRGAFGLGQSSGDDADARRARRKTKLAGGSGGASRRSAHRGLRGPRRVVLGGAPRDLPRWPLAFFFEIFAVADTVVPNVVPQVVLAALVGLLANAAKVVACGENVASAEECDLTFNLDGHLGVAVVLSFLLVFRADLAYERYENGKTALGSIHGGVRNLNVAMSAFLRDHPKPTVSPPSDGNSSSAECRSQSPEEGSALASSALRRASLARDRAEVFRLTNLLYAFVRQVLRAHRHGYSDVGPVTDEELLTRDRGGKPRLPDVFRDAAEVDEFRALEPWNRPNACVSKIARLVERRRRVGDVGERAALDAFRDCRVVLDALKAAERIVTTPIPYIYLHALHALLFFFVYSVPFAFTANFEWATPFPSAVVALAFYGVNEIGRCMEDPYSWEAPCHDLSGNGWRMYRENMQTHEWADEAERREEDAERVKRADESSTDAQKSPSTDDGDGGRRDPAAEEKETPGARARRRMLSGTAGKISTGELLRRAVAAAPVANAALNARAVEEAIAREEAAEAASAAAASGVRSEAPRRPPPPPQTRTRRASSAASVSGPAPPRPAGDGSRRDGYGDGEDDVDADGDPATADPGTLPKELSTHWTGFFSEIFVFRGTVTPTLMPQIFLALFLGVLAQMLKMRLCGPDVIAPAECQTTFDITGHQVVSVSLGFLLVFRTDWAYDRYYEGKQSLGHLYGGLRNLNVLFATYLRENRPGEKAAFEAKGADAALAGEGAGTWGDSPSRAPRASFRSLQRKIREDRVELLRLTNVLYATMRHVLRELRVGDASGREVEDERCVEEDPWGKPPLPELLRPGEARRLLALAPANRHNWIAMRVQMLVETHRRLGNISERAAFEVYQQLEVCLGAYKAMERIVSTPIPFTYLHMLQFILFFFVFSAPFVFTTTFHWIAFVPSVIVAVGFYGINEMGKLIQDPFDWRQPCHDLAGLGLRMYRENLKIHEHAADHDRRDAERAGAETAGKGDAFMNVLREALEREDAKSDNNASDSPRVLRGDVGDDGGKTSSAASPTSSTRGGSRSGSRATPRSTKRRKSVFDDAYAGVGFAEPANVSAADADAETYGEELDGRWWTFFGVLFRYRGTVLPKIAPQTFFAGVTAVAAQVIKIYRCGADITAHSECPLAFSETAHSVAGGIIGFMLVFRTSISYYRFYEGKKHLGHLFDALRNANVAFCSFMRAPAEEATNAATEEATDEKGAALDDERTPTSKKTTFDRDLHADRVELRRLSNVAYAFIRQAVREHRHGHRRGCAAPATDACLVWDDLHGRPSLGALLSDAEKREYLAVDPNNRANVVVWKMQSIVEHHRRAGNISERGAFDIYHDLEACLEAYKHMERIVSTKMPFQYLHMVNFLLFIFVFSAPFVFTTGFKWLSPIPSCIVAIAFYGVAEVARSIEDPYSWVKPCHDLSGVGWRLYSETLQLHEMSVADVDAARARRRARRRRARALRRANGARGKSGFTDSSDDGLPTTNESGSESGSESEPKPLASVARGPADVALAEREKTSTEAKIVDAALRRAKAVAEAEANESRSNPGGTDARHRRSSGLRRVKTSAYVGPSTAAAMAAAAADRAAAPELSDRWYGFFTDVFRLKHTIHAEVFPQVALAFVVAWFAQLAKLYRCGGHVQEAFECAVTFEPHAHSVVGSVLAFMIVYRFKFAYDRYYEAKTAISELYCGLRNFNIGACAFLRGDGAGFRGLCGGGGGGGGGGGSLRPSPSNRRGRRRGFFSGTRLARGGSPSVSDYSLVSDASKAPSALLRERTELLRLSGMLFGFLRHVLREQRLGYPDDREPGDWDLLARDARGSPSLGSLFRDGAELAGYGDVPFRSRPNVVVTRMQAIVERHRRRGVICERGAHDLYRECERVLNALKSCERVTETPIPFQYIQMSNFVTFFFVYSAPFIFTVSYQYISFFPSCLLAMAFYGINSIGEVIERPFDWREPNHDLTGVGARAWRECAQIHAGCAERDAEDARERLDDEDASAGPRGGSRSAAAREAREALERELASVEGARAELQRLTTRAAEAPDIERLRRGDAGSAGGGGSRGMHPSLLTTHGRAAADASPSPPSSSALQTLASLRRRRASAASLASEVRRREYPRHTFSFVTGLFSGSSNALRGTAPQVLAAAAAGLGANYAKRVACGADVERSSACILSFHSEAHAVTGAIIGFVLVFCANIAYTRYYEAKSAVGDIYHGLRNMHVAFAAFLRPPRRGEPGWIDTDREKPLDRASLDRLEADRRELRRLVDVLFAFMRQSLREQRHGYSLDPRARGGDGLSENENEPRGGGFFFFFGKGKGKHKKKTSRFVGWRKTGGGGTGPVPDADLLARDACGAPSLAALLSDAERARYASVDHANRFNVVVAEMHVVVERCRRAGRVYEKAAFDVYADCDRVLAAYKTCERIVTTPIPYQYTHMVNLVLFFFVFSAPFIFTVTFEWLTPAPSAVLALGFYGIWEVGKTMMDPFDWNSPRVDLTAMGRRIAAEAERIHQAAKEDDERERSA